jgi:hypothetical protein
MAFFQFLSCKASSTLCGSPAEVRNLNIPLYLMVPFV